MTEDPKLLRILIKCPDPKTANDAEALADLQMGIRIDRVRDDHRSVEATVLVALVSASGVSIGALITGLLNVAAQRRSKYVVIQGRSGRKLEVPSNLAADRIREYIRLAQELDIDRIEIP